MTGSSEVILIRGGQADLLAKRLRADYPEVGIVLAGSDDVDLASVTIAAGSVPDSELAAMPALDWVHCWAAGVEFEVGPQLRSSGITVTSSAGNGAIPLAEHAMMLTLMLDREAPRWMDAQRERRWERFTHSELHGKTMGIYGFGNVGRELAVRARAFGMRVVALRRRPERDADLVDRMYGVDGLYNFAAECDVLVVAAAKTRETEGAIDAAVLASLKPGAHVVVVSRGNIVSEPDLLDALRSGRIAAAGLDAHAEEPLPSDSPYWTMPGVIVTPHNGATTVATAARGTEIFLANLQRRLSNLPYQNRIDVASLA
jgi:phosphoglycerate dehydrogenase-like enzyme